MKADVSHPREGDNTAAGDHGVGGRNLTLDSFSSFLDERINITTTNSVAYVVIISNEDYVDGALVLGFSLARQSKLVSTGKADLVLMFPKNRLSLESQLRLKCVGWSHLREVYDLSVHAPQARLKDTFNKLHIFRLKMYLRVAIFDADMLIIRNPDVVFDAYLPGENYIAAVGTHSGSYFQTAMMLVIPSREVLHALLNELQENKQQRDYNGRDGRLIRSYFKNRFVKLRHELCIHIRPGDPLIHRAIGLHYRGSWKPWHNREDPPPAPKHITPSGPGQELGKPYHLWWRAYEDLHIRCMALQDAFDSPTRDAAAPLNYNASEAVWLMRHTRQSYVQPLTWLDLQRRNLTHPKLKIVTSEEGASCDEACHNAHIHRNGDGHGNETLRCVEKALSFVFVNSRETLHRIFHCNRTTLDYPAPHHPSIDVRTGSCYINSLFGKRERPTCGAKAPLHRRICACLTSSEYLANISFIPFQSHSNPSELTVSTLPSNSTQTKENEEGAAACAMWHPRRVYNEEDIRRSRRCAAFLLKWESMEVIPRQLGARTIKLRFNYKTGIRAIVKLEQLSFPLEPHAEYAAYATSLLLGIGLVPPTTLLYISSVVLRQALLQYADEAEKDFLRRELWWVRTINSADVTVCVSAQLWVPHDVVSFVDATPPITQSEFEQWLEPARSHERDVGYRRVLMQDIATMVFLDYIIGNEDRSFTHNAFVVNKADATQLVMLDHGKSFYSEDKEIPGNMLSLQEPTTTVGNNKTKFPMCKIPEIILRQASRLLRLSSAGEMDTTGKRMALDWLLLHTMTPAHGRWLLSESRIAAAQLRLERAVQHFSNCVTIFGLQHVIGD